MRVEIDESRSDDEAGRVERGLCRAAREVPDRRNAITLDADVRSDSRRAGAIQYLTTANQEVELGRLCLRRRAAAPEHRSDGEESGRNAQQTPCRPCRPVHWPPPRQLLF